LETRNLLADCAQLINQCIDSIKTAAGDFSAVSRYTPLRTVGIPRVLRAAAVWRIEAPIARIADIGDGLI
jgi:hypothetical protein